MRLIERCDMEWYEADIKNLEAGISKLTYTPKVLFYGSSSIRLWKTLDADFPELEPVNLGFGGSTLAACTYFFERIISQFNPEAIVLYAGDNDLGDGRRPEEVYIFFQEFAEKVQKRFGNIPCFFMSLKPSLARWALVDKFRTANQLIKAEIDQHDSNWHFINIFDKMIDASGTPNKELYDSDGLHLTPAGYQLWKDTVYPEVASVLKLS